MFCESSDVLRSLTIAYEANLDRVLSVAIAFRSTKSTQILFLLHLPGQVLLGALGLSVTRRILPSNVGAMLTMISTS